MSDVPQGPGWWQASDSKWYPPEQFPSSPAPTQPLPTSPPQAAAPQQPGYQPAQNQATYGSPVGYGQPIAAGPKTDGLAVGSLVAALVGTLFWFACGIGILATIAAIPMGVISRNRIRDSNGQLTGEGLATAGAIIGGVVTALGLGLFVFWIILVAASGN